MERIDTIEETYVFYAQLGGVRRALPHGVEYRFPAAPTPNGHDEQRGAALTGKTGEMGEAGRTDGTGEMGEMGGMAARNPPKTSSGCSGTSLRSFTPRSISPRPPTIFRALGFPANIWEYRLAPTGPSKRIPPAATRAS